MRITDILKAKQPALSFEIFPPKADAGLADVLNTSNELAALKPDFMSVTYGAGGGTSKRTLEIAGHLQRRGITALAHLTCVTASPQHVAGVLDGLEAENVGNVLALRGDPPHEDVRAFEDYKHASDLIADIKRHGDFFCVGGACYPDGHPECVSREKDIENIRYKVEAGCDFLITQLFFDNDVLYNFLYRMAANRIDVPVIAGVMPMTSAKQIKRMTALSGAALTPMHKTVLERYAGEPASMMQAGLALATAQIVDLIANGVRGIHLYTMNRPEIARSICENISGLFNKESYQMIDEVPL